ncbi:MAG: radical SAM protein [Anaerolineae bacterium]|nr:radical SAM protein [Thermoflexales bacterium]MDW8407975.1 radical SAM protein [Anaerolineae bacterium]
MTLDKRNLYRLPWSMNDNAIAWLELTDVCNLYCEGCYRQKITGHKPLEQVKEEIRFFKRWRNPDNVSIAGGEPLIYPHILDVVAYVAELKMKPIILTNALALTPELLKELKKARLSGFTIHIDSHQNRPHWKGKTEKELNELRQLYADMIAAARGLYVIFNSTVYPSTYHEIPDVVRWGRENIDKVHGLVFITYRAGVAETSVAVSADNKIVDLTKLSYVRDRFDERFVTAPEVYQIIRDNFPEYDASCYLGGTLKHDSFKWLAAAWFGTKKKVFGSAGKRTMELAQVGHHLFTGTYLAYLSNAKVGAKVFLGGIVDPSLRKAGRSWLRHVFSHPAQLLDPVYVQSIGIIQAPDILPDGRADMCDSCPDMTVWDGKLVNSCRMDEYRLFGGMVNVLDKSRLAQEAIVPSSGPSQN